jgi:hypothetical protein
LDLLRAGLDDFEGKMNDLKIPIELIVDGSGRAFWLSDDDGCFPYHHGSNKH